MIFFNTFSAKFVCKILYLKLNKAETKTAFLICFGILLILVEISN